MKRLLIVAIGAVISFSAYAGGNVPAKAPAGANTEIKAEIKTNTTVHTIEAGSTAKNTDLPSGRIQRAFNYVDRCGNIMTVWVSGPEGTTWSEMYKVGYNYQMGVRAADGCYPRID